MSHLPAPSHVSAGLIAVLVGFTSSAVIIFQAAAAAGTDAAQVSSWLWALCLGCGLTSIGLSLRYRAPVLTAWSTPGAALLAGSLGGLGMGEAVGAFLFSAALITLSGVTGLFARLMQRIPQALAAAMLAGVLLRFGLELFGAFEQQALLVGSLFLAYLAGKRLLPRYTILLVLLLGIGLAWRLGLLHWQAVELAVAVPQFVRPEFSWAALVGVGIPLFVVTMASQNLPGVAVLRTSGYERVPVSPLIAWTGLASLLLAPFGGFAINLAAITAAICAGPEAGQEPQRRYWAALCAGSFYLLIGLFGATVASLFAAFPQALILAIAGLALLVTLSNSLAGALQDVRQREPALITFLVTASGLSLFGVGAAFWGLVAGGLASVVLNGRLSRPARGTEP
ncbi:benzoate/H(+) symporter BenE family transporter [Pseudomonas sp. A-1]|uniref:benzoate/H(+) symporter BenE family transporter n=1 Tax=Pseudomonas sp. A-1 TaxID=1821274 RepID=UPI0010A5B464|nr:benzoate/H(+) symporter BenE family transporter [Pseudomonas sp. A-1]THG84806.1 benzoate/H(+) symporter BenE family transporter [Pseudomonas sp. A-1]